MFKMRDGKVNNFNCISNWRDHPGQLILNRKFRTASSSIIILKINLNSIFKWSTVLNLGWTLLHLFFSSLYSQNYSNHNLRNLVLVLVYLPPPALFWGCHPRPLLRVIFVKRAGGATPISDMNFEAAPGPLL